MKKWIILCGTIISAVIALTIYNNYTEKRIHNEKIELGKKNACEWINKKYGIDVEVIDAEVIMEDDIFSMFEGDNVEVTVREGDKEYHVEISGIEENADGCDDYQAEEIEKALIDMIKADIPEDFEYDFYGDKMNIQRYNGKNLKQMLSGSDSLYIYCVNTEFEEVPVFDFLRRNITDCTFYSFSSQEILDDFRENGSYSSIKKYAPFITGYRVIDFPKRDNECRKYDLKSYDDLLYYVPYEKIDGKIEKGFYEIPESEFDWTDSEYEIVSRAYGIDEKCYDIHVWIPITDNKTDKELYFACTYYDEYKKSDIQKIEKCQIIGSYAFYKSYASTPNLKIALLCR